MEVSRELACRLRVEINFIYGLMDCKKALEHTNGDMEKAKEWLSEFRGKTPGTIYLYR